MTLLPHRSTARCCASAVAAALLVAAATPAVAAPSRLVVSGAWIRVIIPDRPAAGYFTLRNDGAEPRDLVGASSPGCGSLMLHRSEDRSGVASMAMVAEVKVPAHGSVSFAPGGFHLMCVTPTAAVVPGHSLAVTLKFRDGEVLSAPFVVRGASGK